MTRHINVDYIFQVFLRLFFLIFCFCFYILHWLWTVNSKQFHWIHLLLFFFFFYRYHKRFLIVSVFFYSLLSVCLASVKLRDMWKCGWIEMHTNNVHFHLLWHQETKTIRFQNVCPGWFDMISSIFYNFITIIIIETQHRYR